MAETQQATAIFGATSGLAQALCRILAEQNVPLVLVARDKEKLDVVTSDLQARGSQVSTLVCDLDDISVHESLIESVSGCQTFYVFYGSLPDQSACEQSWASTQQALQTNFLSTTSILTRLANLCEPRKMGSLVVVSSVAGDRGRKSNYVYGTAKGALSIFCQGLRNRLASSGVRVLTVKPGFIDTPMTATIEKKPAALWATADKVAADIIKAEKRGKDTLYTPWFWQFIMLIIRSIPERIFKRLSL